jgi:hypothetical protein
LRASGFALRRLRLSSVTFRVSHCALGPRFRALAVGSSQCQVSGKAIGCYGFVQFLGHPKLILDRPTREIGNWKQGIRQANTRHWTQGPKNAIPDTRNRMFADVDTRTRHRTRRSSKGDTRVPKGATPHSKPSARKPKAEIANPKVDTGLQLTGHRPTFPPVRTPTPARPHARSQKSGSPPNNPRTMPAQLLRDPRDIRETRGTAAGHPRDPRDIRGTSAGRAGHPRDIRGTPRDIRGTRGTSAGHPRDIRGTRGTSAGHPRDIRGTSAGHPRDTRDIRGTSAGHPPDNCSGAPSHPTPPYHTHSAAR